MSKIWKISSLSNQVSADGNDIGDIVREQKSVPPPLIAPPPIPASALDGSRNLTGSLLRFNYTLLRHDVFMVHLNVDVPPEHGLARGPYLSPNKMGEQAKDTNFRSFALPSCSPFLSERAFVFPFYAVRACALHHGGW